MEGDVAAGPCALRAMRQVGGPRQEGPVVTWRVVVEGTSIRSVRFPTYVHAEKGRRGLQERYPEHTWTIVPDKDTP
jgi:hypothetical protein